MITQTNPRKDESKVSKEQYTLLLDKGKHGILVSGHNKKREKKQDAWFYLGFAGQIGYAIALPIAGGALLGSYIDRTQSTYPKATLLLLFIGLVVSVLGFIKTIQDLIKRSDS